MKDEAQTILPRASRTQLEKVQRSASGFLLPAHDIGFPETKGERMGATVDKGTSGRRQGGVREASVVRREGE